MLFYSIARQLATLIPEVYAAVCRCERHGGGEVSGCIANTVPASFLGELQLVSNSSPKDVSDSSPQDVSDSSPKSEAGT